MEKNNEEIKKAGVNIAQTLCVIFPNLTGTERLEALKHAKRILSLEIEATEAE